MKHLNHKFEYFIWIKDGVFLLEHSIIDCLKVQEIIDETKHQYNLELDHLQEMLDPFLVFGLEAQLCQEFDILLH